MHKCMARSRVGKHTGNPTKRIPVELRNKKQKSRNALNWNPRFMALRGFADMIKTDFGPMIKEKGYTNDDDEMIIMDAVNWARERGIPDRKIRTALIQNCPYDMTNSEAYLWSKEIVC